MKTKPLLVMLAGVAALLTAYLLLSGANTPPVARDEPGTLKPGQFLYEKRLGSLDAASATLLGELEAYQTVPVPEALRAQLRAAGLDGEALTAANVTRVGNEIWDVGAGDKRWRVRAVDGKLALYEARFTLSDVSRVRLERGSTRVVLEKTAADRWVLAGTPPKAASLDLVRELLHAVRETRLTRERQGSPENFGLADGQRSKLVLEDAAGRSLAELSIGRGQEELVFARLPDTPKDTALEISQDLERAMQHRTRESGRELSPEAWLDFRIVPPFDHSKALGLAVTSGDRAYRLARVLPGKGPLQPGQPWPVDPPPEERPRWRLVEPLELDADQHQVNGIVANAAYLRAEGYADEIPPAEHGFDPPRGEVTITLHDGKAIRLLLGAVVERRDGQLDRSFGLLKVAGEPHAWKVDRSLYDALQPSFEDVKGKPTAATQQPPENGGQEPSPQAGNGTNGGAEQEPVVVRVGSDVPPLPEREITFPAPEPFAPFIPGPEYQQRAPILPVPAWDAPDDASKQE